MSTDYEETEEYSDLRQLALSLTVEELGFDSELLAIVMETGYEEGVVTLVVVADGSSSIYFSNGGGIIGAGEYEEVNASSLKLFRMTKGYMPDLKLTTDYPLPKMGFTRFYAVTKNGVYTQEVLEDDLGNERHNLSPMFLQAHEVISYINDVDDYRNQNEQ